MNVQGMQRNVYSYLIGNLSYSSFFFYLNIHDDTRAEDRQLTFYETMFSVNKCGYVVYSQENVNIEVIIYSYLRIFCAVNLNCIYLNLLTIVIDVIFELDQKYAYTHIIYESP